MNTGTLFLSNGIDLILTAWPVCRCDRAHQCGVAPGWLGGGRVVAAAGHLWQVWRLGAEHPRLRAGWNDHVSVC